MVTCILQCHECSELFTMDNCGCIVTDCPLCGEPFGVWTLQILEDDNNVSVPT
jgi:hypothetical protein